MPFTQTFQHGAARKLTLVVAVAGVLICCVRCGDDGQSVKDKDSPAPVPVKPTVVCTTPMIAQIVRQMAGEQVLTYSIMRPTRHPDPYSSSHEPIDEPSTYTLRPSDLELIKSATVVLAHGDIDVGLLPSLRKLTPNQNVVTLVDLPSDQSHSTSWLLITNYRKLVTSIHRTLDEQFDIGPTIGHDEMLIDIDDLQKWAANRIKDIPPASGPLLTNSPTLAALGRSLGIKVIAGALDASAPPTIVDHALLDKTIQIHKPAAIWFDVNEDDIWIELIHTAATSAKCNVVGPLVLDMLTDGTLGCQDYISLIKHNVHTLVAAMQSSE